jgi:hypothetical protein
MPEEPQVLTNYVAATGLRTLIAQRTRQKPQPPKEIHQPQTAKAA